jgi:hypothetical protein
LKLPKAPAATFTVRLYCRAPGDPGGGYDISLQGKKVLEGLDAAARGAAGASGVVHEIAGVRVTSGIDVTFSPSGGKEAGLPLVCGIELIREDE